MTPPTLWGFLIVRGIVKQLNCWLLFSKPCHIPGEQLPHHQSSFCFHLPGQPQSDLAIKSFCSSSRSAGADLTIKEHRPSQMWQNLGYSLGNSLRAATMTWEGPTGQLKFWFGDAAFLMEKSFTHKINSHAPQSRATEINGKALSDSQEFLPGLRLPLEMPAHPLPWAFLTTGVFSAW